jgi:hypothetical protein
MATQVITIIDPRYTVMNAFLGSGSSVPALFDFVALDAGFGVVK